VRWYQCYRLTNWSSRPFGAAEQYMWDDRASRPPEGPEHLMRKEQRAGTSVRTRGPHSSGLHAPGTHGFLSVGPGLSWCACGLFQVGYVFCKSPESTSWCPITSQTPSSDFCGVPRRRNHALAPWGPMACRSATQSSDFQLWPCSACRRVGPLPALS